MKLFALLVLALSVTLSAQTGVGGNADIEIHLVPSAQLAPDAFKDVARGPFGLPFVAVPTPRFMPVAKVPQGVAGRTEDAFVRAALKIGKDGKVAELKIIEARAKELIENVATAYLRALVFDPVKKGKEASEFETEYIVVYRPKRAKKKG